MPESQFEITTTEPFRLDLTAWALKRRPIDVMHFWDGSTFARCVELDGSAALISVKQLGDAAKGRLQVSVRSNKSTPDLKEQAVHELDRLLGLNIDLTPFYEISNREKHLKVLVDRYKGFRPPRFPSIFEAFVCAVACQQLSLHVGILMLNRLVEAYATPIEGTQLRPFPQPRQLADAQPEDLMKLTFSRNKANYIIEMAKRELSAEAPLDSLSSLPDDQLFQALTSLKGIGRWSAEYVMLRGFGRLNSFPIDDSGARAKLTKFLGLDTKIAWDDLAKVVAIWRPYSGLLYFHLLLDSMEKEGLIQ